MRQRLIKRDVSTRLHTVRADHVCWDCMTETDERRENFQCTRCWREYDDGSEDDD